MIDWFNLAANTLWILAGALALGTFSYASWRASMNQEKLRSELVKPHLQLAFNLAGVLFCLGLAATAGSDFEIILWFALGFLFLVQMFLVVTRQKVVSHQPKT